MIETQDTNAPNCRPLMRVQPMCVPRKARPLPRPWSDHGCILFFSMRGACDRWWKYYNGWSYIMYREFQEGKTMWECSLRAKYVYMTVLTVLCQRHTWREDITYSNQGAAGGSSFLSLCYVGTPTMAIQLVYRTHLKGKERMKKREAKKTTRGSKKKTVSRQWRSMTTL